MAESSAKAVIEAFKQGVHVIYVNEEKDWIQQRSLVDSVMNFLYKTSFLANLYKATSIADVEIYN